MSKDSKYTIAKNGIGAATVVIAVFSLLAKVVGLVRDAIFSHNFGTGVMIDAYFAAFRIPDFLFNLLILGTFSVAFIPVFSKYLLKDQDQSNKLASSIINITLLAMAALSLLALIFINPLVSAIAPGFTGQARELTKLFAKIFLLSPIFLSLSSITSSILNTYKRFMAVALAPVLYNASIIFGVLVLYPRLGPTGLAWGVVLGAFLHFAIQLPQLFSIGFRYLIRLDFRDLGFIEFWKLYWPRIFSMGTGQVTLLVASIFGSFLGTGSLSAFYYANNLGAVFLSIFAVSAALAVFPALSDLYNQRNLEIFKGMIAKTSVQILFFIIPLSVFTLILRAQIVRLILGIGQATSFTFANTRLVALTLGLFAISLFAQGLIPLFSRAFYALQNTMIPVVIGLITIVVNIFATYWLTAKFGVPGMALAFSISVILNLLMLIMELHHKIGHIFDEYLIINSLKIIICAMLAGLTMYLSLYIAAPFVNMHKYLGILEQTVVASLAGGLMYVACGFVLNLDEAHNLLKLTRSMLSKFARPLNFFWSNPN